MRQIEPKMVQWLDERLKDHGGAQLAIANKDPRRLMRYAAEVCIGIKESGGNNKGPLVELIQETIGKAEREPWCMGFVQTMIAYAETKTGVKSRVFASEHCMTVWRKTNEIDKVVRIPAPGAIIIWRYHENGKATEKGHTGLLELFRASEMDCIEGNTEQGLDASGRIVREGGGVYQTVRKTRSIPGMELVGFIKPF